MKALVSMLALFLMHTAISQEKELAIKNVTEAGYNYIDTFYKSDPSLAHKSIHLGLRKVGWWFDEKNSKYSDALELPFYKLIKFSKRWNANGDRVDDSSPRKVEVLDVADKIAIVKVTAVWGIDYLNLVNTEEGWKIINITWQSKPKFSLND